MDNADENELNVDELVKMITTEGRKTPCDDSNKRFEKMELPSYYDDSKFKSGQKFFHDHIFSMFYAKLLGLVCDLAAEEGRVILQSTKQSSDPESAFRRYTSTIFHMTTWYSDELKPGSRSWESLERVRRYHNTTSKMCKSKGIGQINQYQMAGTQFGFMGLVLARPEAVGMHNVAEEDLEGFVHFWRVIGYVLGMEERFNICQYSVKEIKLICDKFIEQNLKPEMLKWDPDYLYMTEALISGMWCMAPLLNKTVWLRLAYDLVSNEEDSQSKIPEVLKMNIYETVLYYFTVFSLKMLKFEIVRIIHGYHMNLVLYTIKRFPFLAYYKFGKINFNSNNSKEKMMYVN